MTFFYNDEWDDRMKPLNLDSLLETVVRKKASDLHLTVGLPPMVRLHGRLLSLDGRTVTSVDTEEAVKALAPEKNFRELEETGSSDFGYSFGTQARFRISVYRQKGEHAVALRLIPFQLIPFEQLGLPDSIRRVLHKKRGLVIVTGPTGSGKTTTQASMIDYVNTNMDRHIITIEDPIEYFHDHKKSILTQREIGYDVNTFPEALRRALRQDPDVILVGEMRDNETVATAIRAAETGHLVMGTLHTTGAARTVDRVIDSLPPEFQDLIRSQLAFSLEAVISQALIPRKDTPGVVAAFEVLTRNSAVENHIRKMETFKIASVIQTSRKQGMVLMDDFIAKLWRSGVVSGRDALSFAQNPESLRAVIGDVEED